MYQTYTKVAAAGAKLEKSGEKEREREEEGENDTMLKKEKEDMVRYVLHRSDVGHLSHKRKLIHACSCYERGSDNAVLLLLVVVNMQREPPLLPI